VNETLDIRVNMGSTCLTHVTAKDVQSSPVPCSLPFQLGAPNTMRKGRAWEVQ